MAENNESDILKMLDQLELLLKKLSTAYSFEERIDLIERHCDVTIFPRIVSIASHLNDEKKYLLLAIAGCFQEAPVIFLEIGPAPKRDAPV